MFVSFVKMIQLGKNSRVSMTFEEKKPIKSNGEKTLISQKTIKCALGLICFSFLFFSLCFRNIKEQCNVEIVTPKDKKYICRQKFVRITLKALNELNVVFDDLFYYPSHCICELVTIKHKTRKPKQKLQKCSYS